MPFVFNGDCLHGLNRWQLGQLDLVSRETLNPDGTVRIPKELGLSVRFDNATESRDH
jgi:hypothetical protein